MYQTVQGLRQCAAGRETMSRMDLSRGRPLDEVDAQCQCVHI